MRVVVALGGNALQRRGEPMTIASQRENVRSACLALAPLAMAHELVISHGNGPQVGLLALQSAAYDEAAAYPFDVLGAQTEGMIGYLIEQELGNLLPFAKPLATVLTMTEVAADDPAFANPTKFVGPIYDQAEAEGLAARNGWTIRADGGSWRRVVASPAPLRIFELRPIKWLLDQGAVVICTGGGGIPTMYEPGEDRHLVGVDAVIDKDLASAVLARDLDAELLLIVTDAPGVALDWGTPAARWIRAAAPEHIRGLDFAAGSMGPKVRAAVEFVTSRPGATCVIGGLGDLPALLSGEAGTRIAADVPVLSCY
jgi:carbamate kinase